MTFAFQMRPGAGGNKSFEVKAVFRAEIHWFEHGPILKMEGRLAGAWAEQARTLVNKSSVPAGLIVDLTELSYIDVHGEEMLVWLSSVGASFIANNVYALAVCERLQLPVLETAPTQRDYKPDSRNQNQFGVRPNSA